MIKEFIKLLAAIATLAPVQFLLLLLGLAASVCLGFPVQRRHRILGFLMPGLTTLVWGVLWVVIPNALVDWVAYQRTRLIIKRSNTFLSLITNFNNSEPQPMSSIE